MTIEDLVGWANAPKAGERAAAAEALCHAFLDRGLDHADRRLCESALTMLLGDPSPKVRAAISTVLAASRQTPLQILAHLAADQPEVAGPFLIRSPLLTDGDLVDLVVQGSGATQQLIAMRPALRSPVSAAVAELAGQEACLELLLNRSAQVAAISYRRMVERFAAEPGFREAALQDPRLPADCRHKLAVVVSELLGASPLMVGLMGSARAARVTRDACARASLGLVEATPVGEYKALIEHLRLRGDLTTAFVLRCLAGGHVEFFGHVLAQLTGFSVTRVRGLLVSGREGALGALFAKAGIPNAMNGILIRSLGMWRAAALGDSLAGPAEVSLEMLKHAEARAGNDEAQAKLAVLLKAIHAEVLRRSAVSQIEAAKAA